MRLVADLHVHSRHSMACSPRLVPEELHRWAQLKGVSLLSTGDFTHPGWLAELKDKLEPAEPGLWRLKAAGARAADAEVPASCRAPVRFVLGGEVSCVYRQGGRVRKVHHLLFCPSFEAAAKVNAAIAGSGNLASDGRPVLSIGSKELLGAVLSAGEGCCLVPAHAWTPHFGLLGSESGFDSLEECFGDLSAEVFAMETGLSSDPPMNWRVSPLDRLALISSSDAHSPEKLAREAVVLETELSYRGVFDALRRRAGARVVETIEFFPEEGKYHLDGHRKCSRRLSPEQTLARRGLCPECGKPVTQGVLNRVERLADRRPGRRPEGAADYARLVPLKEVLAQVLRVGASSARVERRYHELLRAHGSELSLLRQTPAQRLQEAGEPLVALALLRMRRGQAQVEPGYDGLFGRVGLLNEEDFAKAPQLSLL